MTTNKQWQFITNLSDPEYRKAFVDEMVGTGLAFQIRRLRNARSLTQKALADQMGNNQVTISQWENPGYGSYSLSSLKQLASAFDVGLLVRFVSFSELADWTIDVGDERLTPPTYEDERQLSFWRIGEVNIESTAILTEDEVLAVLDVGDHGNLRQAKRATDDAWKQSSSTTTRGDLIYAAA